MKFHVNLNAKSEQRNLFMKLNFKIITLLLAVNSGSESNDLLPLTGAGGSSGPGTVGPNLDVGMVLIDGSYHSYIIVSCELNEKGLLKLDGEGTTDSGRHFHIMADGKRQTINISIKAYGDFPVENYISLPFMKDELGFEIVNRTVSANVRFHHVGHVDALSGYFRAECR